MFAKSEWWWWVHHCLQDSHISARKLLWSLKEKNLADALKHVIMRVRGNVSDGRAIYLFFWIQAHWLWAWCPAQALLCQQRNPDSSGGIGAFCKVCAPLLLCHSIPKRQTSSFLMWWCHWSTWLLGFGLVLCCQGFSEWGPNCQVCSHSHKTLQDLNKPWIKVLVALRGWGWWKKLIKCPGSLVQWHNSIVLVFIYSELKLREYKVQL